MDSNNSFFARRHIGNVIAPFDVDVNTESTVRIEKSTADGTLVKLAIAGIFFGFISIAWRRAQEAPAIESSAQAFLIAFTTFVAFWTLGATAQWLLPVRYTTLVTPEAVVFMKTSALKVLGGPHAESILERSRTVNIHRSRPPWHKQKLASHFTYDFEMEDGKTFQVDYRWIWAGNQNEFATAIERLWNWPPLPKLSEMHVFSDN